jgi:hypothetical protein
MNKNNLSAEISKMLARLESDLIQTESQIEQDILDLLQRGLGYTNPDIKNQVIIKGDNDSRKDIVLYPKQNTEVIIEVKRPDVFSKKRELEKAIVQVASYIRDTHNASNNGIVTDGINWKVFELIPHKNYFRAHIVLSFSLRDDAKLSKMILTRFTKFKIINFLKFISAIHVDLHPTDFDTLMNISLSQRIRVLKKKAKLNSIERITADDIKILTALYSGGFAPVAFVKALSLGNPLNVTLQKMKASRRIS